MKNKNNQYFVEYAIVEQTNLIQQLIFKSISIYSLFKFEFVFYKSRIEWYRLITMILIIIPHAILISEYYILLIPILYFDILYMILHPGIPIFTYDTDKLEVKVDHENLVIEIILDKKPELSITNIRLPITFVIIAIEQYLMDEVKNKKELQKRLKFIQNHMTIQNISKPN